MKARMMAVACDRLFSGLVPTTEGYMYAAAVGMLIAMLHAGTPHQGLFQYLAVEDIWLQERMIASACMRVCPPPCQDSREKRTLSYV